jgi:hypothetical protein
MMRQIDIETINAPIEAVVKETRSQKSTFDNCAVEIGGLELEGYSEEDIEPEEDAAS